MTIAFDPKTAPPSVFPAQDGAVYEQIMGRWSRRLAPLLIEFGTLGLGHRNVLVVEALPKGLDQIEPLARREAGQLGC